MEVAEDSETEAAEVEVVALETEVAVEVAVALETEVAEEVAVASEIEEEEEEVEAPRDSREHVLCCEELEVIACPKTW